jgi:LCP family protein required for cell wall assembly
MPKDNPIRYSLKVLASALYTLFLAGGLVCAYLFYTSVRDIFAYSPTPPLDLPISDQPAGAQQTRPDWSQKERVNILLLGVDQLRGEEGPWRSDTMIVVTVDPKNMSAGLLSIPRDLYVEIPGYGEQRINMAHFWGDAYDYPGGGPALAMRTVEYNLGIPIHYYIRVNYQGFRDVIDYLGGIKVNVPEEIWDYSYPDGNYGYITVHIPAGEQIMDGRTALRYVRTRHASTDFQRLRRQQQVLMAIRDKALGMDVAPKIPTLVRTMGHTVQTNLTLSDVMALAQIATSIGAEDIRFAVIDETMTVPIVLENGADVLFPRRDKIGEVIQELFYSEAEQE